MDFNASQLSSVRPIHHRQERQFRPYPRQRIQLPTDLNALLIIYKLRSTLIAQMLSEYYTLILSHKFSSVRKHKFLAFVRVKAAKLFRFTPWTSSREINLVYWIIQKWLLFCKLGCTSTFNRVSPNSNTITETGESSGLIHWRLV